MKRYPGTFLLLISSLIFQVFISFFPDYAHFLAFDPRYIYGWVGLITYQVSHASWGHLFGNFLFGLPFMLYLEKQLGKGRFLKFYFLCGLFSALFQLVLGRSGAIGSSGSIYGCMVGACLYFGESLSQYILALGCILLLLLPQLAMAPYAFLTGIAHYGHIGGAIGGLFLCSRLFRKPNALKQPKLRFW